jgi:AraC-like DNA-binding protein
MMNESGNANFVNATGLSGLERALAAYDIDYHALLRRHGFPEGYFDRPEARMLYTQVLELLESCIEATADNGFILELVKRQQPRLNGYLGMLLKTAPDLRQAIEISQKYMSLHVRGTQWVYQRVDKFIYMELAQVASGSAAQTRLANELGLAQGWIALRDQCASPVKLSLVQISHSCGDRKQRYEEFFNCAVDFEADTSRLIFPVSQLELPMSHSDAELHQAISDLINLRGLTGENSSLIVDVRACIKLLLPQGDCSVEQVARHLLMSKRTLQRRLKEQYDASFNDVFTEERLSLAKTYLAESKKSISDIAYALGYDEPSNMSRFFKERVGISPREWRRQESTSK